MSQVETIISAANSRAENMANSGHAALQEALSMLAGPMSPATDSLHVGSISSPLGLDALPAFPTPGYDAPSENFGDRPSMESMPGLEAVAPTLGSSSPVFREVMRPASLRVFNKSAPEVGDLTIPPAPSALSSMDLIPPTLTDIVIPPAPSVVLPEFDAIKPNTDIDEPGDLAAIYAANYANMSVSMRNNLNAAVDAYLNKINPEYSAQMTRLETKLAEYIEGGTALTEEVENAIYNRARDKTNSEYLKTRDQIMKDGAARGFTIPSGAQFSALAQARQMAADNNARTALDIAIKQAELEQANIQFAITQSASLRNVVLNATAAYLGSIIQLNGQALEYSRDVLNAAVAVYETMVKIATAKIEIYKAEAQVYESRLKAVLAVYDIYQAEIKALEAQVNIDRARVDAFRATADAYGALANAYRATIDGVVAQGQIEKIKADIFGVEVQAYSAEVSAKNGEWNGFVAQVNGETARQQAYGEEVRAYSAEVEAYRAKIGAYEAQVRAISARNEGAYRVYTAAVSAYEAQVRSASENTKAQYSAAQTYIQGYVAQASAAEAHAKASIAAQESNLRNIIGIHSSQVQAALTAAAQYNSYTTAAAGVAVSAGSAYASMASSAMSGVNSLAAAVESTSN